MLIDLILLLIHKCNESFNFLCNWFLSCCDTCTVVALADMSWSEIVVKRWDITEKLISTASDVTLFTVVIYTHYGLVSVREFMSLFFVCYNSFGFCFTCFCFFLFNGVHFQFYPLCQNIDTIRLHRICE